MSPYQVVEQCIENSKSTQRYILAYSGGLDSTVLLHVMATLSKSNSNLKFQCIHINHSIQTEANIWQQHCEDTAKRLAVEFQSFKINESCPDGESLEAWAREQRYTILKSLLDETTSLLTAHHQDDQVETFFLNLFRGSGVGGLTAMPETKELGKGKHIRPFLNVTRERLEEYANENNLAWIEDPSNSNNNYDRNFLRNSLLPNIQKRWQGVYKTIFLTSKRMQESQILLKEMAEQDLKLVLNSKGALSIVLFQQFNEARQKNLLLHWAKLKQLDMPGQRHIEQCLSDLCSLDKGSKSGCVAWANTEIRRYRDCLYLMQKFNKESLKSIQWSINETVEYEFCKLVTTEERGKGLKKAVFSNDRCELRFRQRGESIYCKSTGSHIEVKNIFQEHGVLPWYREAIPLIYVDNVLVCIPELMINESYLAEADEIGIEIKLNGFELLCQ